ncbi:MAG: hypothetical protein RL141_310 [Candidatus Parcubacteria bacterium]|jgi:Tfp pilus assembly protein PilV
MHHASFVRGQTLVELMVAMFVIIVGLAGASNVIFSNARAQAESAERVTAGNLAREAVELAKAVRDSNWVAGGGVAFDAGLSAGTDYTGVPRMEGGAFIDMDFTPNAMSDATAVLKRSTNPASAGLFVQGTGASGSDTPFRRLVTFAPICADGSIQASGSACTVVNPKIGVRVSAVVEWTQRTGSHDITVEDELYDWR